MKVHSSSTENAEDVKKFCGLLQNERKTKFLRSKLREISKRVLRTMKTKIERVMEAEMDMITKLKYQAATEMFRKIWTTPLVNDEKIMNFPGNSIRTLIFWQTTIEINQETHHDHRFRKYQDFTSIL